MFNPNDPDLDPECLQLCLALNRLDDIQTTCSCCGHGKEKFSVWFQVSNLNSRSLLLLSKLLCGCKYDFNFDLKIYYNDTFETIYFCIKSKTIDINNFILANQLAQTINDYIDNKVPGYNVCYNNPPLNLVKLNKFIHNSSWVELENKETIKESYAIKYPFNDIKPVPLDLVGKLYNKTDQFNVFKPNTTPIVVPVTIKYHLDVYKPHPEFNYGFNCTIDNYW
jgi:hypothetical protein